MKSSKNAAQKQPYDPADITVGKWRGGKPVELESWHSAHDLTYLEALFQRIIGFVSSASAHFRKFVWPFAKTVLLWLATIKSIFG